MDVFTTVELANKLEEMAENYSGTDKGLLLSAAHFLRLYGAIEQVYRKNLCNEFYEVGELVNNLFKKPHTG